MVCAICGSTLRADAKFCNRCGNRVAQKTSSPGEPAVPTFVAVAAEPHASSGANALRPQAAHTTIQLDKSPAKMVRSGQPAHDEGRTTAPAAMSGAATHDGSSFVSSPSLHSHNYLPEDQLPWPLVVGIILDGRYRVEAIAREGEAENAYSVTDLRGYEECWACGEIYGPTAAGERFCRECGADMFARELIMTERLSTQDAQHHESDQTNGAASDPREAGAEEDANVRRFAQSGRMYEVRPKLARHSNFPQGARLIAGATSDAGRARGGEVNEDSALVIVLDRIHESRTLPLGVFAVADGLGGHASGNRASRQAIHVIAHTILRQLALPLVGSPSDPVLDESQVAILLVDAVREANAALCANNKDSGQDAGSTVVAALILGDTAYVANVGDSRGYVLDEGGLRRITSDHSLVQQLVAGGLIEPDEVYTHPQRNQIYRSLGDETDLPVDVFVQQLSPSMRILLCSDGLWEMVRDPHIEELMRLDANPQAICDQLVAAANDGGGEDNITAVLVEVR